MKTYTFFNNIYKNIKNNWIGDLLLLTVVYIALFNQLGSPPMFLWDEGQYAVNALEMSLNGNYLLRYFDYKPDLWAVVPPMKVWFDIIFIKLFGYSELSIRLTSALSGVFIVILFVHFFEKKFNNRLLGYFASFVLLTTQGYVNSHVTRTGDLDSLLILFTTMSVIFYYKFLEFEEHKRFNFIVSAVSLLCAFFTKSLAGFFFLPGMFFYTLYKKKLKMLLMTKEFYISIGVAISIITAYLLLVEQQHPGILKIMYTRVITDRFFVVNENHVGSFWMYLKNLRTVDFATWFFILPLSVFFIVREKNIALKNLLIFFGINSITYWLIVSSSQTKTEWYIAQIFPHLSVLVAITIYYLYLYTSQAVATQNKYFNYIFFVMFTFSIFWAPLYGIFEKTIKFKTVKWSEQKFGIAMTKIDDLKLTKKYTVLNSGYNPHIVYYKEYFNDIHDYEIDLQNITKKIEVAPNSTILFYHTQVIDYLNKNYNYSIIMEYENMKVAKVDNLKNDTIK